MGDFWDAVAICAEIEAASCAKNPQLSVPGGTTACEAAHNSLVRFFPDVNQQTMRHLTLFTSVFEFKALLHGMVASLNKVFAPSSLLFFNCFSVQVPVAFLRANRWLFGTSLAQTLTLLKLLVGAKISSRQKGKVRSGTRGGTLHSGKRVKKSGK